MQGCHCPGIEEESVGLFTYHLVPGQGKLFLKVGNRISGSPSGAQQGRSDIRVIAFKQRHQFMTETISRVIEGIVGEIASRLKGVSLAIGLSLLSGDIK
jgi:hypothetical protein